MLYAVRSALGTVGNTVFFMKSCKGKICVWFKSAKVIILYTLIYNLLDVLQNMFWHYYLLYHTLKIALKLVILRFMWVILHPFHEHFFPQVNPVFS